MGAIPGWALVHTISIEPYLGTGGTGPRYGPAVEHRCLAEDVHKLLRQPDDREATVSVAVFLAPGTDVAVGSRATLNGRTTTVAAVMDRDGGGLPTPDHIELGLE